jgi:hypothetical protein
VEHEFKYTVHCSAQPKCRGDGWEEDGFESGLSCSIHLPTGIKIPIARDMNEFENNVGLSMYPMKGVEAFHCKEYDGFSTRSPKVGFRPAFILAHIARL